MVPNDEQQLHLHWPCCYRRMFDFFFFFFPPPSFFSFFLWVCEELTERRSTSVGIINPAHWLGTCSTRCKSHQSFVLVSHITKHAKRSHAELKKKQKKFVFVLFCFLLCNLKCWTTIWICRFMSSLIWFTESRLKSEIIRWSPACRAGLDHRLLFLELIKKGVRNEQGLFKCEEKGRVSVCVDGVTPVNSIMAQTSWTFWAHSRVRHHKCPF